MLRVSEQRTPLKYRLNSMVRNTLAFLNVSGYLLSLICCAVVLLLMLAFLKVLTIGPLLSDPLLVGYSVLVTLFQLSRLGCSMAYRRRFSKTVSVDGAEIYEPLVTFVIPCMNEEFVIENTVSKCFAADYPEEKLQVIVINDGSTDNTISVLRSIEERFPRLEIVDWTENRGKRHAMHEGFGRATGEIIVQLDSDSYIDPAGFRNLIEPFRNPEIGAVCGHADPQNAEENLVTRIQAAYYFTSFRILKGAESTSSTVLCCSGCSSAYRKSTVLPILDDWLNESFLGRPVTWGDDRALTSWVLKLGYKTVYTDLVSAYTIVPNTWKKLFKQQVRWKKGWIVNATITSRFIFKRHPWVSIFYYFPLVAISFLTPIMAFRAMIYTPVVHGTLPIIYIANVLIMASVMIVAYRMFSRSNKYWPYVILWSIFSLFVGAYLIVYALLRIQDRKWVTR